MVKFIGVSKFNLKNINLKVEKGEFLVICGGGGAGKTTLLKLICGDFLPDKGSVNVFGVRSDELLANPIKKRIGFIPQEGGLLEEKDVMQNFEVPLKLLGEYNKLVVLSIIERLGLYAYREVKASELSGSQRQLLKIGVCVAKNPLLLLADEPLQNLDPEQEERVTLLFKDMNTIGASILFATSRTPPPYFTRELHISNGEIRS